MAARHVGEGSEVKALGQRLERELAEIERLNETGKRFVEHMQADVKDQAYTKAEGIVNDITQAVKANAAGCHDVAVRLKKYGEFLDDIASH